MTVSELIAKLQDAPSGATVVVHTIHYDCYETAGYVKYAETAADLNADAPNRVEHELDYEPGPYVMIG